MKIRGKDGRFILTIITKKCLKKNCFNFTKRKFCSYQCYWNGLKGRTLPEEQKRKISIANKGGNKTSFKKGSQIGQSTWYKKGNIPWSAGKHIKLNNALDIWKKNGGKLSNRHIEFLRFKFSGENNPNWKGGITSVNQQIRHSKQYSNWRMAVFQRDNFTCIKCGDNRGGNLQADHIKPFAFYPELRFEISNGRTLCIDCHRQTDTYLWKSRWEKDYANS